MLLQKLQRDHGIISCVLLEAQRTLLETTDTNLECVSVKQTPLWHTDPVKSQQSRSDMVTRPGISVAAAAASHWARHTRVRLFLGLHWPRKAEAERNIEQHLRGLDKSQFGYYNNTQLRTKQQYVCRPEVLLRHKHKVQEHEIVCRRRLALFLSCLPFFKFFSFSPVLSQGRL